MADDTVRQAAVFMNCFLIGLDLALFFFFKIFFFTSRNMLI